MLKAVSPYHLYQYPQSGLAVEQSDNCKEAPEQSSKIKQAKILNSPLCKDKP